MILIWPIWFQQDDATCYTANKTIQLLHETFPGRVLFRFGDQNWPPRSCDLTPLDFFLWGYLKSKIYVNNPTTTRALQEKIKRCINEIQQQLCRKIMKNFDERMRMCQQSRGDHLPDVLFHKYPMYFMIHLKNKYLKTKNFLLYLIQILH